MNSVLLPAFLALAITSAPAKAQKVKPNDPIAKLADKLFQYGVEREAHDRLTFPKNMPKAGQPYDPVTGEALPLPKVASER